MLASNADFGFEAVDILRRISTQIYSVRADEAHRISSPGQIVQSAILDGLEMIPADAKDAGYVRKIVATAKAGRAQIRADSARSRNLGTLAGLVSCPTTCVRLFDRQLCNLGQ